MFAYSLIISYLLFSRVTISLYEDASIAFFAIFEVDIRIMKQILFPFFLLVALLSCKNRETEMLNIAEGLLDQKPDSALIVLQSIDQTSLNLPSKTARYALLMTKALDKNYIDVTSDSLTRQAVNYYSSRNNKKYKMQAWYYHALVQMNNSSYTTSVVALEEAEKEARDLNDSYQLGLIMRAKARLFKLSNNNPSAIEYRKKSDWLF